MHLDSPYEGLTKAAIHPRFKKRGVLAYLHKRETLKLFMSGETCCEISHLNFPLHGYERYLGLAPFFTNCRIHVAAASLEGKARWCFFSDLEAQPALAEKRL